MRLKVGNDRATPGVAAHPGAWRGPRPSVPEPLRPHLGEDHLAPFGAGIGHRPPVTLPLELEVVGPDPRRVHAARGDVDHTGRCTLHETGEEQAGEQELAGQVGGQGLLQALGGQHPLREQDPDIVDQDLQARLSAQHRFSQAPDLSHRAQVGSQRRGLGGHLPAGLGQLVGIPAHQEHPGAESAQPEAVARPRPPVAPVTRTVFPARSASIGSNPRACSRYPRLVNPAIDSRLTVPEPPPDRRGRGVPPAAASGPAGAPGT